MRCPNCNNTDHETDAKFCHVCGASVVEASKKRVCLPSVRTFTINDESFDMILVEGGTFYMGLSPKQAQYMIDKGIDWRNRYPLVTLPSYYIGQTVVTQALWKAVMNMSPVTQDYWETSVGEINNPSKFKGDNLPVENVSWNNCYEFINIVNESLNCRFRLPSEAEWEFASKGGNKSKGYEFSGSNNWMDVAWAIDILYHNWRRNTKTKPVKQKLPNELGLYDMNGNVWEWCQDWYEELEGGLVTNPQGPAEGNYKVLRGFSVFSNDNYGDLKKEPCRRCCAYPGLRNPALYDSGMIREGFYYDAFGFRLALSIE